MGFLAAWSFFWQEGNSSRMRQEREGWNSGQEITTPPLDRASR